MICRRREGELYRQGLSVMWSRYRMDYRTRWYVGLFVRIGGLIVGFRYRWPLGWIGCWDTAQ